MSTKQLVQGALIGALYAVLTAIFAPISFGLVQLRVSEALCVTPYFTYAAVPGLFIGCLIVNLIAGAALYDVVFGSLATLIAALLTWLMRKRGWSKWLAPLPAVVINALVVGALLTWVYQVGTPFGMSALYVGLGQFLACYVLGMPLLLLLERFGKRLFSQEP